ncbi:MAG: pantoate--beta-alanine ligase [Bacteroidota bacterium]
MILFKTIADLTLYLDNKREDTVSIGFVPTMGALHDGHLSLVEHSKKRTHITACSIFVNPTQFNDPNDFAKYPVTLEQDLLLLEKAGCDIVFLPSVAEMYPNGTVDTRHFDLGHIETILEGKYRPGHFQGVCQVVHRLLEIVQPTTLFLGRKDYQQCMVIKKLIELAGWNIALTIIPTLREASGLALSSRNLRLSEQDRKSAAVIYQSLLHMKEHLSVGDVKSLTATAQQMILNEGFEKIDYVTIADADSLAEITEWNGETKLVALVAAFISGVRLIDNMPLN